MTQQINPNQNRNNDNLYWQVFVIAILCAIAAISLILNGCNPIKRTTKQYIIKHDKLVRIAPIKELELAMQWHPIVARETVRIDTFLGDTVVISSEPIILHDSVKGDVVTKTITKIVYRDIVKVVDSFIIDTKQTDFWRTKFNELTVSDLDNQSKAKLAMDKLQSEKSGWIKWCILGWIVAVLLIISHILRSYL